MISSPPTSTPPYPALTGQSPVRDKVNKKKLALENLSVQMNGYILVGMGEKKNHTCGRYKGTKIYRKTKEKKLIHDHCDRATCPVCFQDWLKKVAKRTAERITDIEQCLFPLKKVEEQYWKHVSASVKETHNNYKNPEKLRRELKEILPCWGLTRGTYVFHPARKKFWADGYEIRNLRYSPHFHIIAVQKTKNKPMVRAEYKRLKELVRTLKIQSKALVTRTDKLEFIKESLSYYRPKMNSYKKALNWNFKNHGVRGKDNKETKKRDHTIFGVVKTLEYELSHAGTILNKTHRILRSFGDFSISKKHLVKSEEVEFDNYSLFKGEEQAFGKPLDVIEKVVDGQDIHIIDMERSALDKSYMKELIQFNHYYYVWIGEGTETRMEYKHIPVLFWKRATFFPGCVCHAWKLNEDGKREWIK